MQLRGQHIVALIFAIAVAMGGYSWWNSYQRGRRILAVWGSQAAVLIRYAPQVELWRLGPSLNSQPGQATLELEETTLVVQEKANISDVRGLVHARHALVEDSSFVWPSVATDGGSQNWTFAMHFVGPAGQSTLVFDTQGGQVKLLKSHRSAVLQPTLAAAFKERSRRWASDSASSPVAD